MRLMSLMARFGSDASWHNFSEMTFMKSAATLELVKLFRTRQCQKCVAWMMGWDESGMKGSYIRHPVSVMQAGLCFPSFRHPDVRLDVASRRRRARGEAIAIVAGGAHLR